MWASIRNAWTYLFPGRAKGALVLYLVGMFAISFMDMLGVAAILPLVQLMMGGDTTSGYLGAISSALGDPSRTTLLVLVAGALVLAFVIKAVASLAIKWWSSGFVLRREVALSAQLLERYVREPYLDHRRRKLPEIIRDTQDAVSQSYTAVALAWLAIASEVFSALVLTVLLLVVVPIPAIAAIVYFTLSALVLQSVLGARNVRQGEVLLTSSARSQGAAIDAFLGFREVRLHNRTRRFVDRFRDARTSAGEAGRRSSFLRELPRYVLEIVFIVGIVLILALIMATTPSADALPSLLVFAGASIRILPTFTRTVANLGMVRVGRPALELVVAQLKNPLTVETAVLEGEVGPSGRARPQGPVHLGLHGIGFTYPDGDEKVLSDVTLDVPAGTSIAFVGGSGSGKTTLVDITLGLIDPDEGRVTADGQDIQQDLPRWFDRVGYVPQDMLIMDATIAENVAFGEQGDEIDPQRVRESLRSAQLADVVDALPNGIDQLIGGNGIRLSGGQRQRLGIARALYGHPGLLVLDEATSALDNETEARVTRAIRDVSGEATVLVVAHRLSTVRHVDQLAYFSGGRIAAVGTFEEVLAADAEFAHMVELGRLPGV